MNTKRSLRFHCGPSLLVIVALLIGLCGLPPPAMPRMASAAQLPSLAESALPAPVEAGDGSLTALFADGPQALTSTLIVAKADDTNDSGTLTHPPQAGPTLDSPDLVITKTATSDPAYVSALLTYTLIVTNHGTVTATGVILTDALPAGVTFVSATPSRGTCSESSGVVTCRGTPVDLVSNSGAETGDLSGWTILLNGGDGWSTTTDTPHQGSRSFITSYDWDTRYQEINLLAAGFSAAYLDGAPAVAVGEWFRGFDCGGGCDPADKYYFKVELRNASHVAIASWNVGTQGSPATATANWTEQAHTFSGYGAGLRYLYFEDGGKDVENWNGHFGAQMDDAYATVTVPLTLAPGEVFSATLVTQVDAAGVLTNTAQVGLNEVDSNPLDNTVTITTSAVVGLTITKSVTPTTDVPYHGVVTYAVIFSNVGVVSGASASVTDTLPAQVDFGAWIEQPAGASVTNDQITWSGAVTYGAAITFTFAATHTGNAFDVVTNSAYFRGAGLQGSDDAVFGVICGDAITVQNANDAGPGSLRQAIADVCPNGRIDFDSSLAGQTITLTAQLEIMKDLTIDGSSLANPIQISGNNAVRVFRVAGSAHIMLDSLRIIRGNATTTDAGCSSPCGGGIKIEAGTVVTLTHSAVLTSTAYRGGGIYSYYGMLTLQNSALSGNSASSNGGGIYNNQGTLTVQNSTLSGNSASYGGGIRNEGTLTVLRSTLSGNSASYGGGIWSYGTLTVLRSTLSGNSAHYVGGGIYNYDGTLTVQNSTLSGNSADFGGGNGQGGGIFNSMGTLTVQNSTLSGNSATFLGGGIYNYHGTLDCANTIIANSGVGGDCRNSDTIRMNIHNLVEDGSCSPYLSGDPLLGPLADNGGDTLTHALLPGSKAIDAGDDAACLPTDQRGIPRQQGRHCDIGAYEVPLPRLAIAKSVTPTTEVPYHGVVTYTVILSNIGALSDTNVLFTDMLPTQVDFGAWIVQPAGASEMNDQLAWSGPIAGGAAITFTFTATHTGSYGDGVTNIAHFSGTLQQGSDEAVFSVVCLNNAITVQNADDAGPGSLRQAIANVCPNGRIDFDSSLAGQTITLMVQLEIMKNLTIDGSSLATPIQISGNNLVRVFRVAGSAHITLDSLRIVRGRDTTADANCWNASCGGGIKMEAGAVVTLTHSAVLASTAYRGGGISNLGTLTVQNSTLSGNSASGSGGGIFNAAGSRLVVQNSTLSGNSALFEGGGICNNLGTLTVQNSTLSGNLAAFEGGGGIENDSGTLTVQNSTLSGNAAPDGGGIYNDLGTLHYQNTIIANSAGGDCFNNGTIGTNTRNLVEDGSCGAALSGDPLLGPLADNGGDTLTHALLPGSPAVDAGDDASCLPTDQRGIPRPQGAHCDIGAYEALPHLAIVKSVAPATEVPYHGVATYTVILSNTGALSDTNVLFTDTLPAQVDFGAWIVQPPGASEMNDQLTWSGPITGGAAITFTFTATHTGSYGDGVTNTAHFSGTVQQGSSDAAFTVEPNYAPVLEPIGNQWIAEGNPLTFTATATDDGVPANTLTFTLDAGSVGSITANGTFTWTPTEADGPGSYTATVRVSDGNLDDAETITVTVNEVNTTPVLDPIGDQTIDELATLAFTATASDSDIPVQPLTFTLDAGSVGSITPGGAYSWTPSEADGPGSYTATVRASDGDLDDAETITITVSEINVAPVLDPIGGQTIDELATLAFTAAATDNDVPANPLTFTLDAGSVGGITPGGAYSWTPSEADGPGSYTATVRVSDGDLDDAETITVTVNEVNTAPEFTSTPATMATQAIPYTCIVTVADVDIPTNVLTITAPVLPGWLALTDNGDGTATLTGTPTNAEVGQHSVTLLVQDSLGASDTQAFTLTVVNVNDAPLADNDVFIVPQDSQDNPLDVLKNDTDIDGDALAVSAIGVPSEEGIAINGSTHITYTPAPGFSGAEVFTYTTTDGHGGYAMAWVTVIASPASCIAITQVTLSQVTTGDIYTDTLVEFSATLAPPGFTLPYMYTFTGGSEVSGSANPLTFTLSFATVGPHPVEVAVRNCAMTDPVTDTVNVFVSLKPAPRHTIFLPVVLKNQ